MSRFKIQNFHYSPSNTMEWRKRKKNQMVTEFKAGTFQQECFNTQKGTNVLHRYIQPFELIICT